MTPALVLDLDETLVQMGPLHHVLHTVLSSFPPEEVEQQMAIFRAPESILTLMHRLGSLRPKVPRFLSRIAKCEPRVPVILYTDAGFDPAADIPAAHQYDHLPYIADAITYAVNSLLSPPDNKWDGFHALLTRNMWYTGAQGHDAEGHHFEYFQRHDGRGQKNLVEIEEVVFENAKTNILFLDDRHPDTVVMDRNRHAYLRAAPYKSFERDEQRCKFQICDLPWKKYMLPESARINLNNEWRTDPITSKVGIWDRWLSQLSLIERMPVEGVDERGRNIIFPDANEWWSYVEPWLKHHGVRVPPLHAPVSALPVVSDQMLNIFIQ